MIMLNAFIAIYNSVREKEWQNYKRRRKHRLVNKDFTVIASNCSGMFMYYDMGMQYLTPTVNLSIEMKDFVKMVRNLKWYMGQKLVKVDVKEGMCPVGMLGDVKIDFIHYDSFEEGVYKWEERKGRINWNNLFIVGSEKDGCTYETIREFEELPYKNKVIFTHREYPEFTSAYYIRGFEENKELGTITKYKPGIKKRRYLDDFDYVKFINEARGYIWHPEEG